MWRPQAAHLQAGGLHRRVGRGPVRGAQVEEDAQRGARLQRRVHRRLEGHAHKRMIAGAAGGAPGTPQVKVGRVRFAIRRRANYKGLAL